MSLSLKNVSKNFGEKKVIDDFSYTFPAIGIVTVIGASGIGKTTLLRIISGLEEKTSGAIVFPSDYSAAFAFQEHRLFPNLTALENLTKVVYTSPSDEDISSAKAMLLRLGFGDNELSLYPDEMSGGMRQRVSLARAFLKSSTILLLDEPTKELDSSLIQTVIDIIKEIAKERLIIIVSHDMEFVGELDSKIIDLNQEMQK